MSRTPLFRMVSRLLSRSLRDPNRSAPVELKLTRREGFALAGTSAAGLYLNACQTLRESSKAGASGPQGENEILIVGGGAAGLATAYYLKQAGLRSHIFEANKRLGGRIFTHYDFNAEKMFCERGGELIDTGHKEIQNLMMDLGLKLQHLPDPSRPLEGYFFEGKWRGEEELLEGFAPLASKIAKDAALFVVEGEFKMPSYKDKISDSVLQLDHTSLKAYLDSSHDLSPPWVRELIRVAYVGEYGLEAEEQSSINLVSFIGTELSKGFKMFGESDELYRIEGGNSRLIEALAQKLQAAYSLERRLVSIARSSKGRFQLLFQTQDDKVIEAQCEQCVLTLPFTVLRGIKGIDSIGLSPRKLAAIRELGYGTNSKLMLGFKKRYWRDKNQGFPSNDGNLLSDLPLQGGWDTSRQQKGRSGIFTNFMGGRFAESFTGNKVDANLKDLETIYPGIAKEHDGKRVLQVWPAVPTAKGSYICPKPGQYTDFGGIIGESECEGRLHFAGEHTSEVAAGFMNGAVESGLRVATALIEDRVLDKSS